MSQMHQEDVRETARETGTSPPSTVTAAPVKKSNDTDLMCSDEKAKALVAEVIGKHPPESLLSDASQDRYHELVESSETRKACNDHYKSILADIAAGRIQDSLGHTSAVASDERDVCIREANNSIQKSVDVAEVAAAYALKDARLQSKDQTTGAIVCKATVHVELPQGYGSAEREVRYKIEKMEDGGLHIDIAGLD